MPAGSRFAQEFGLFVRAVGFEPTHPYGHRPLKPTRLPVPPRAHVSSLRVSRLRERGRSLVQVVEVESNELKAPASLRRKCNHWWTSDCTYQRYLYGGVNFHHYHKT
jgi:hypothetical protein